MAIRLLGSYSDILGHRGSVRFVVAGWLGRLSRSTTSIATILLVSGATGSYTLAGGVAGAIVVGIAVSSPVWARAIDTYGQTRMVPVSLAASLLSAVALAVAVLTDAAQPLWFVAAFFVGATTLDYGTLTRARWSALLSSPEQRHTSLALESVADESVYVIGPPLVTFLAAIAGPIYGFAAGVLITLIGGIALAAQRATAPPLVPREAERPARSGILPTGVLGVLPLYIGIGFLFASIDITSVSVARSLSQPWIAGVIVASFSIGSVVSAFLFGPLSASWPAPRRVLIVSIAFALAVPTLLLVHNVVVLTLVIFVAGLVTSPVLISAISLIQTRTEPHRLTEALTWPSIGLSIGLTAGATIAGIVIDRGDAWSGFLIAAVGAVIVGLFGVIGAVVARAPRRSLT